jgi:hypothetical protein
MRTIHQNLAAASTVALLLVATGVPPALGATAAPIKKLTKTTAEAAARADAEAGATISGGDKVIVSDCRRYGRAAYKCAIELIPEGSASRCRWTDTISLVKGKADVKYSAVSCSQ